MNILFSNAVRIANSSIYSLFDQFWATPNLMLHVSSTYVLCLLIICFCLYCSTRANLIYKVLNLAVLSVFVVALWSYLTDVTFIYVVYILTFVSAVVMLFLSVVLMLPSSAVAVPKRATSLILLAIGISTNAQIIFNCVFLILILTALYLICALCILYGTSYLYEAKKQRITSPLLNEELLSEATKENLYLAQNLRHIQDNYEILHFGGKEILFMDTYLNATFTAQSFSSRSVQKILRHVNSEASTLYFGLTPKILTNKNTLLWNYGKKYLGIAYEFLDFFLALLNNANIKFPQKFSILQKFTNRQYIAGHVPIISEYKSGRRGVLILEEPYAADTVGKHKIFLYACRPWWSPFVVFSLSNWTTTFAKIKKHRFLTINFLTNFFYKMLISLKNKFMSFTLKRILGLFHSSQLETSAQIFASISIFLLAIPWAQFNTGLHNFSFIGTSVASDNSSFENLAAIQHELYVGSPLLLLVCVVGLLVALVGAALLVSTKVLNSR